MPHEFENVSLTKFLFLANHCPDPTDPDDFNGAVSVLSSGTKFNDKCPGINNVGYTIFPQGTFGNCHHVKIELTGNNTVVWAEVNYILTYTISFTHPLDTPKARMILKMSQPVSIADLVISGIVRSTCKKHCLLTLIFHFPQIPPPQLDTTIDDQTILVSLSLDASASSSSFQVQLTNSASQDRNCIDQIYCHTCANNAECQSKVQQWDFFDMYDNSMYDTTLTYTCPTAFEFEKPNNETDMTYNMTCQWDETWTPSSTIPSCIRKIIIQESLK